MKKTKIKLFSEVLFWTTPEPRALILLQIVPLKSKAESEFYFLKKERVQICYMKEVQ